MVQSINDLQNLEHDGIASARRNILVDSDGNIISFPLVISDKIIGNTFSYEGNLTSANSPITLNVSSDLGRNSRSGYIVCDSGSFQVQFSDGTFGGIHTIKKGEVIELDKLDISEIKLIWVSDSDYRILVL